MKKTIFSVLIGAYDTPRPAPKYAGWDSILFTDQDIAPELGWKVIQVSTGDDPKKESRRYKILSHQFLSEYELVCYIDMNIHLKNCPPEIPFWFRHPKRKTVYEEAKRVIEIAKDKKSTVDLQMRTMWSLGFTDTEGLYQNGFFCRRHTADINRLHDCWWDIVEAHSHRDQLSLPYAIWRTGIAPENIRTDFRHYINIVQDHMIRQSNTPSGPIYPIVHHITPGRTDKNLGKAINQLIEGLPDGDWICVRDIDTIPPHHRVFFEACEKIAHENRADLIGCLTNRLGMSHQLLDGIKSENTDFRKEIEKAEALWERFGTKIFGLTGTQTLAGLFMLFSKKTWEKAGKFPEGSINIDDKFVDYHFFHRVKNSGGKIGIAKGIYLFHNYRLWAKDTKKAIEHLL